MNTRITKYDHACLLLERDGEKLIIDPGAFTVLPADLSNIVAIVISEEHQDHYHLENVKKILQVSPDASIFSTQAVAKMLKEESIDCEAVGNDGTRRSAGAYTLQFSQEDHAIIYETSPCRVITTLVDRTLYYPSDSFVPCTEAVEVLALPTSGPWHKISEAIGCAHKMTVKKILPVHNGLLNEIGNTVANRYISENVQCDEYLYLEVGKSHDVESE